mmetsp:Transcript_29032/g.91944  ORF Transcript_29032/g.91944 Transcript_29032/m.91944 type:complete len:205 (+) Transcript_29032:131-745(+)
MFSVTATKPSRRAQAARPPERQVRDDRRVDSKHAEDLPRQVARVPPTTCARSERRGKGSELLAGAWPRGGGSELTVPLRPPLERQRGGSGARRGAVGRIPRHEPRRRPAGAPASHGCVQDGGLLAVAGPDGGVAIGRVGRPRARALEAPLVGGKLLPERPAAAEVKLRHDVPRAADAGGEGGAGAAKLPLLPDGARRERLVGGG